MNSLPPRLAAADWLSLAATPTFAAMALATLLWESEAQPFLCSPGGASPLGGMVPMYVLMAVFHSAPWLKLISRCRTTLPSGNA